VKQTRSLIFGILLMAMFGFGGSGWARAEKASGFEVLSAQAKPLDHVLRMDANIRLGLSEPVIEAVRSGVPQIITIEMRVKCQRDYLWDQELAALNLRYELSYHALSGRYIVTTLNTRSRASYATLGEALFNIGSIRDFPLVDVGLLPRKRHCYGEIRAALDIESLPTPIKLTAYTHSDWWLGSDWLTWPIQ